MASDQPSHDPIDFAEQAMALLDEGTFVATYKFAVLLALMDLCLERSSGSGEAPRSIPTDELAEKVIGLYWPQVTDYPPLDPPRMLSQNAGRSEAAIVSRIELFRNKTGQDPSEPLSRAKLRAPEEFERLRRDVEKRLIKMPLPRLQVLGREETRFIYEYDFSETHELRMVGSASEYLVQLAGLLRPLIQQKWSNKVRRINHEVLGESELDDFLFGSSRVSLQPVSAELRKAQRDRCFYCGRRMAEVDIDHFLPWIRHPDNGIFNLVAAHPQCNNAKRDFLAAVEHLRKWRTRFSPDDELYDTLHSIAEKARWEAHPERTLNTGRGVYLRLHSGVKLWLEKNRFENADSDELLAALADG